jgi:hypothetical protein
VLLPIHHAGGERHAGPGYAAQSPAQRAGL